MIRSSEQINELFLALSKAQGEFKVAKKESTNGFHDKKYADFESCVEAVRPALCANGLSFLQIPMMSAEKIVLITRVCHSSGQWIEGEYPINPVKSDPQSVGAATTYSRRYALSAMLGIVASDEDDDAESAMDRQAEDRNASKAEVFSIMKKFSAIGVSETQVIGYLGIQSADHITVANLKALYAIGGEIKSGAKKKEDYFKVVQNHAPGAK